MWSRSRSTTDAGRRAHGEKAARGLGVRGDVDQGPLDGDGPSLQVDVTASQGEQFTQSKRRPGEPSARTSSGVACGSSLVVNDSPPLTRMLIGCSRWRFSRGFRHECQSAQRGVPSDRGTKPGLTCGDAASR